MRQSVFQIPELKTLDPRIKADCLKANDNLLWDAKEKTNIVEFSKTF